MAQERQLQYNYTTLVAVNCSTETAEQLDANRYSISLYLGRTLDQDHFYETTHFNRRQK